MSHFQINLPGHQLSSHSEQIYKCIGQLDGETCQQFALKSLHTFTAHVVDFCELVGTADPWMAFTSSSPTKLGKIAPPHVSPLCNSRLCGSTCTTSGLGI